MVEQGFAKLLGVYLLLVVFIPVTAMIPQGSRYELIRYYFNQGHTWKEICGFLLFVHNIAVSLSQVKRIVKLLHLRRYNVSSPLPDVICALWTVFQRGYSNAGYTIIWRVLNSTTDIRASQETVRRIIGILDPEGVDLRLRHRLRRRTYINQDPNYLIHIDGYDKLKPFGIAIHVAIDGFSRRVLWLEAAYSNNDPQIVARYYLNFIRRLGRCPRLVRGDAGTENVLIRDLQVAFRYHCTDGMSAMNSYISGPSTSNQRIERFWVSLKYNFTVFWRNHFKDLSELGFIHVDDPVHLECLRYCFLPKIQRDLDAFVHVWNLHRIRRQTNCETPSGIPNVLYDQPVIFGARDY